MALTPVTALGPYEIQAPLGAGGMGEVYKARDTRLDRTVAIKVLPEHLAADPDLKQRFEREAKTVAALSHPNICPVVDVGSQDVIDFLVMEYLEGETLAQRLEKGASPLEQALHIAIEIRHLAVALPWRTGSRRGQRDGSSVRATGPPPPPRPLIRDGAARTRSAPRTPAATPANPEPGDSRHARDPRRRSGRR